MTTIDQKTPNGNSTNEPSIDASQEPTGAARSGESPPSHQSTQSSPASTHRRSPEATAESAPDSDVGSLIAELRTRLKGRTNEAGVEQALSTFEQTLRRPIAAENNDHVSPPASASRSAHTGDDKREGQAEINDEDNDDHEPPTSGTTLVPMSRLAVRQDGVFLVSLEDADARDLEGREIIRFMVLSPEEAERARTTADGALANAAASIIGRLPRMPR